MASRVPVIADTAIVYPGVELSDGVVLSDYVVVGHPREELVRRREWASGRAVWLGENVIVLPFSVIYDGARIGQATVIEERGKVGFDVSIGSEAHVINGALVHDRASVGDRTVIGGKVCEDAVVGDDCAIMGDLLHDHSTPDLPWGQIEPAPVVGSRVVVGSGAVVSGGVTVGHNVFIAANSIVTQDVPPQTMVLGINKRIAAVDWRGASPRASFWEWTGPAPKDGSC